MTDADRDERRQMGLAVRQIERIMSRSDYAAFVSLSNNGRWVRSKAAQFLCRQVERFLFEDTGEPYDLLVVTMPPQHGKSMTVTETLPSWYLGKCPERRVICLSYNDEMAARFGRRNRNKFLRFTQDVFGVCMAQDNRSVNEFEVAGHAGSMVSCGMMSGVTGRPADLLLIDDPIKNRQEADSEAYRSRLWEEWQNSYRTRLAPGAKVILIQTRWHEDDLAGRILAAEPRARLINLPCEAEENDPLGRPVGSALSPEIGKGDKWLYKYKLGFVGAEGARAWNALFQDRPSPQQGAVLQRQWWRYYDQHPVPEAMLISVDAAFKSGENNDFVCLQVWGRAGGRFYLLDLVNRRLDFPQTLEAVWRMSQKHPQARPILIEDKANGSAIIQTLQRRVPGVVPVNPGESKLARVHAVSPLIESGCVYLPRHEPFTGLFVEQCCAFPHAKHDDMVDAMSQALARLNTVPAGVPEIPPHLRKFLDYGM